jgi:glycosidase
MNRTIIISLIALLAISCASQKSDATATAQIISSSETHVIRHPEWVKNATIYEINVRQHTPQGTFQALEKDLNRLDSLGVDILWLMPINPIGELNRKGSLGSYYSVKNYVGVNSEFGTLQDFKHFVNAAHAKGMKVILDWVANHTAWDHPWITEHPEWYTHDANGKIVPPVADWSDVADLNFDNKELRKAMIESMKFWVKECDLDGYRCDVAMQVPTDFWDQARAELDAIKPVFMLAEAEQKDHHLKAFDMCYGWEFLHLMNGIAKGEKAPQDIDTYMEKVNKEFPQSTIHMYFTTNHDENTWNGTGGERYGMARNLYDVLAFTIGGMPLVYSGQEGNEQHKNGLPHRYRFFDKDTISFNQYQNEKLYNILLKAHHEVPALWNGADGGQFKRIYTSNSKIYAYSRTKRDSQVIVMLNFNPAPQSTSFTDALPEGIFNSIFDNKALALYATGNVQLPGYGYQIFVKK